MKRVLLAMIVLLFSALFLTGCPSKQVNQDEENELMENDSFEEYQSDTSEELEDFLEEEPLELEQENADTAFNHDQ